MKKKMFNFLKKTYGILMTISFFAGGIPLVPFIIALIVGGEFAEKTAVFLQKSYYPWVIVLGSVAIVIGLIAMYLGKIEGLSVKNISADEKNN